PDGQQLVLREVVLGDDLDRAIARPQLVQNHALALDIGHVLVKERARHPDVVAEGRVSARKAEEAKICRRWHPETSGGHSILLLPCEGSLGARSCHDGCAGPGPATRQGRSRSSIRGASIVRSASRLRAIASFIGSLIADVPASGSNALLSGSY